MKYQTIFTDGMFASGQIDEKVNAAIKKGWKPQGGIAVTSNGYCQAMVKEEEGDSLPLEET